MAKENKVESSATEGKAIDNELLKKLLDEVDELKKTVQTQQETIAEKDKAFESLKTAVNEQNKKSLKILPESVIEREKAMREKVVVFVTPNPLDPKNTHVPVLDPITNKIVQVKRGEHVEVNRAVFEILQHSMKSDNKCALLATELSDKFKEDTENL